MVPCPIDANGRFTSEVTDFVGQYVKDADKNIKKYLKGTGRLIVDSTINHEYPYCWRSDTPLIYRAVPSWFVAVEKIKDRLLANNKATYWVPQHVQEGRFHNWLADAHDWCSLFVPHSTNLAAGLCRAIATGVLRCPSGRRRTARRWSWSDPWPSSRH